MTDKPQFRDLIKLAKQRTRDAVTLVNQLLDDDAERAQLLSMVAVDLIEGAACYAKEHDPETSDEEVLSAVLAVVLGKLGIERVLKSIGADTLKRQEARK